MQASGGWEFSGPTGGYVKRYTGERMSATQFDSQYLNPAYVPIGTDSHWGVIATIKVEGYDLPINAYGMVKTKLALNSGNPLPWITVH